VVQVGSWGYYMQGNGHQREVDICGSQLSERLSCSVHYPAYGKRLFECRCGVLFPAYVVQAAVEEAELRKRIAKANVRIKAVSPRNKWMPVFAIIAFILILIVLAQMC